MARLLASILFVLLLGGCSLFPPPRPLAPGEAYVCVPGSAIARRIVLPPDADLSLVRLKRGTCAVY